jgi:hypothetical protein
VFARNARIVAVVAVALAGCGGGDDASPPPSTTATGSGPTARAVPEAARPVAELAAALERLGAKSGCADVLKLVNRVDLPEPSGGPTPRNCGSIQTLLGFLRRIKVTDSVAFRTGAIVDGSIGGRQVAFEAALDQTRSFRLIGLYVPRPQVGTKPRRRIDFKGPAAAFVRALRAGDCKAARAEVAPFSRLAYASEKQFCSVFRANFLDKSTGLGARLRADPGADLVDLGGTRDLHFFGLATKPAGYRTIVVGKLHNGASRISDSLPVEP